MTVKAFTFNAFSENTYILSDETKSCVIIDPGCSNNFERQELETYITEMKLNPVYLLNTHCHIDHILGNRFISERYNLKLAAHKKESVVLQLGQQTAMMYQIPYESSPDITIYLDEGDIVRFGNSTLEVLFTPGHSPASISFLNKNERVLISGDVLFNGSIGRTDLPGGNFETLTRVIKSKFFTLPPETIVYSGHGEPTTIGHEMKTNPFF